MVTQRASSSPRPVLRASITSLGCRVNQAEMEAVGRFLQGRGIDLMAEGTPVDLHVVNTCSVTAVADDKSRKALRRARRTSPDATLVVTGCAVAVDPAGFAHEDPRALLAASLADGSGFGIARLLRLPPAPGDGSRAATEARIEAALPTLDGVEIAAGEAAEARIDRTRAFVKVQDGCSFHCTYCIIPRARGPERSIATDAVLAEVRRALAAGQREIVLTGINVGTYDGGWSERGARGAHARSATTLAGLVRRILAETDVERIRLSSIEPQHVDDDLLEAWRWEGAGRCLPHFHLPLQSGDDGVLRRMGRRYDTARYAAVVAQIRAAFPGAAVHADAIVGFPTEDDAAWNRSLAFVRSLDLAGIHVFRYSERPGTPATRMAGHVPEPVRRARAAELLALAAEARRTFAARALGRERRVLFEQRDPAGGWTGHADDNILVRAGPPGDTVALAGELARVAIERVDPSDAGRVIGRLLERLPRSPARPAGNAAAEAVVRLRPGVGGPATRARSSGGPA
jgi:threonylcarbamoyladenosine tRNA methylthiotransferase MtaB